LASTDLEGVYRRHQKFVFGVCSRYTGSRSDAEDLTQETFVKVFRGLAGFRQESELGTWLYRMAVNTCLDYLRKRKRENRNLADFIDSMVVYNLDPDGDRVLAKLELERILGHLRPQLRAILFLTLAEGLSYSEAAGVMKLSQAAVSKSVSRFLKKYRKRNPVRYHVRPASNRIGQNA
jgi:RNA polymerase sigma-70 factor, ECF subfamily